MNSILAIIYIAIGSVGAASFYIPLKKVKEWAWEVSWLVQGIAAWIISPWLFAWLTMPSGTLLDILLAAPKSSALWAMFFGFLWGMGGLTFGLSIRYLGVSLGQSIALGLCAAFGTLIPPLIAGQDLLSSTGGILILIGVSLCIAGIVLIGYAGILKEKELSSEERNKKLGEFALKKGLLIAIIAGAMSASFNFGFEAATPIENVAIEHGSNPLFAKNPSLVFILFGGFVFNLLYCIFLMVKNKTGKDFLKPTSRKIFSNTSLSLLAGLLWFLQFHFYGMGASLLPDSMSAFGWSILMALNIVISNVWGIFLKEWKGASLKTYLLLITGLSILVMSTFVIKFG